MAAVSVVLTLAGVALSQVLSSVDHSRGHAAARYLAARLGLARSQAVARGVAVGLVFDEVPGGFAFTVFVDGNGSGIRTADIQAGIDVPIEPATRLFEQFPGVDIGLTSNSPGTDAVQLGRTNILTFTPTGTATAGTIHLRDRQGTQWAVRALGATGRTRVLRYDPRTQGWLIAE